MKTFSEMQIVKNVAPVYFFTGYMSSNKTRYKPRNSKTRDTGKQRARFSRDAKGASRSLGAESPPRTDTSRGEVGPGRAADSQLSAM